MILLASIHATHAAVADIISCAKFLHADALEMRNEYIRTVNLDLKQDKWSFWNVTQLVMGLLKSLKQFNSNVIYLILYMTLQTTYNDSEKSK